MSTSLRFAPSKLVWKATAFMKYAPCSLALEKSARRQSADVKLERRRSWPLKSLPWRSASPNCKAEPRPNSPPLGVCVCGDLVLGQVGVGLWIRRRRCWLRR